MAGIVDHWNWLLLSAAWISFWLKSSRQRGANEECRITDKLRSIDNAWHKLLVTLLQNQIKSQQINKEAWKCRGVHHTKINFCDFCLWWPRKLDPFATDDVNFKVKFRANKVYILHSVFVLVISFKFASPLENTNKYV